MVTPLNKTVILNHQTSTADVVFRITATDNESGINYWPPTDENPTITFTPAEGAGTITPFSYCNKHGMWKGSSL